MQDKRNRTGPHPARILNDDIIDSGALGAELIMRLRSWYYTAETQGDTEGAFKHELRMLLRDAIEGVTGIPPEHIIIDLNKNDSED
jgi:hypothetical protein